MEVDLNKIEVPKAWATTDILKMKFNTLPFEGAWEKLIGRPELAGFWIIMGDSGMGKTTFAMQLAKYIAKFAKVGYNAKEEGACLSIQDLYRELHMEECGSRFQTFDDHFEVLCARLSKRNAPKVIFLDTVQYFECNYEQLKYLKDNYSKDHLFIGLSHIEGNKPDGTFAKHFLRLSHVKLWVQGYKAFLRTSRFLRGSSEPYIIWEEGAENYWAQSIENAAK